MKLNPAKHRNHTAVHRPAGAITMLYNCIKSTITPVNYMTDTKQELSVDPCKYSCKKIMQIFMNTFMQCTHATIDESHFY